MAAGGPSRLRVLVTRPQPDADTTAAQLVAMGHEAVVLPLSATLPLDPPAAQGDCEATAVTSSNAIRHAPLQLLEALAAKPCFAVGDKTAEAARSAGLRDVQTASGDATALANQLIARTPQQARIVYLCGRVRRPDFEAAVLASSREIVAIETYDTHTRIPSPAELDIALAERPIDVALLYSQSAAIALGRLLRAPQAANMLAAARFACLSARVASMLDVDATRITLAGRPNEEALLAVLPRLS